MKALISALCSLFAVLFALTFYVAGKANDGLVEQDYYRKANSYLSRKETEERLGLVIRVHGRLATGPGRLLADISTAEGPLHGVRASLRAMRLSGPEHDRIFPMQEVTEGKYAAEIDLPSGGSWMLLLAVDSDEIRTERRWIATAEERRTAPERRQNIHDGPVTKTAGGQTVILDISPKPVAAMRELTFLVTLPGYDGPVLPILDLGMPGMRMPPNRVNLSREAAGRYRGKGVVVRCSSGKRRWTATVILPGGSSAVFSFDVVT